MPDDRHALRERRVRFVETAFAAAAVLAGAAVLPGAAHATFHFAHISEILTSHDGDDDVQFLEITMDTGGQHLVTGTKLNVFDASGAFVETVLTVPSDVTSGANRPWIMGTTALEALAGVQVDFEFPGGSLPTGGGMVCWGEPGDSPEPISCPSATGIPYVDCVAYGTYSGPTNPCIGDPHPAAPDGHSLRRVDDGHDNATDFACVETIEPANNANQQGSVPASSPCPAASTTTTVTTTTLEPATTTTLPPSTTTSTSGTLPTSTNTTTTTTLPGGNVCGDANGDTTLTASDALIALRTAVGSGSCAAAVCDVDDNGTISAADALRILAKSVGQAVDLTCPVDG